MRRRREERQLSRLEKRAAMVQLADLPSWIDNTISACCASLRAWERGGEVTDLTEALEAARASVALLESLERRISVG